MKKPYLSVTTLSKKKKKDISEGEITSHREMDGSVWKLGYACVHLNVRKPILRRNDLNSPHMLKVV